jgi:TetR/AcrR family transcriptional regulator, transcriptional repressor of aconitase
MTTGVANKTRLTRAESKEHTHRSLIEAADRVFMRHGYQRATLDSIAAEAGFTKGAVYSHFRSKDELFIELLVDGLNRNIAHLDQLLSLGELESGRIHDGAARWIDQIGTRDNLPLLALEMELVSRCNAAFAAQFDQVILNHQRSVARLITRYFEIIGRDPPMPTEELTASIFTLAKGIALARQTRPSAEQTSTKLIKLLLGVSEDDC